MYGYVRQGATLRRTMGQDDVEAVCTVYPASAATTSCEAGNGMHVSPAKTPTVPTADGCPTGERTGGPGVGLLRSRRS